MSQSGLNLVHEHEELLIENGKTVIKHVCVDYQSQSEAMIKNGITDITKNCYVDYGSRTKVPIKKDSAENNEKCVSWSCFRISFVVFEQ